MPDALIVLYCLDPLKSQYPESQFTREARAAERNGICWHLIDHDALIRGDVERALSGVPKQTRLVTAIYRGWMVTSEQYEAFDQGLKTRGITLINSPDEYRHCHHFPESYSVVQGNTPRTVWLPGLNHPEMDRIMEALKVFGGSPLVLKDYVKSQKHAWNEACFIPSAADRDAVERVVRRFLELQGERLVGGLVFREFVNLQPLDNHPQSGMPLTLEYRLFYLDHQLLLCTPYWDHPEHPEEVPPLVSFTDLARAVRSRFFTVDVARRTTGDWLVVEMGDAQVAGLPAHVDEDQFYAAVFRLMGKRKEEPQPAQHPEELR